MERDALVKKIEILSGIVPVNMTYKDCNHNFRIKDRNYHVQLIAPKIRYEGTILGLFEVDTTASTALIIIDDPTKELHLREIVGDIMGLRLPYQGKEYPLDMAAITKMIRIDQPIPHLMEEYERLNDIIMRL